jgi:hypothetical protein
MVWLSHNLSIVLLVVHLVVGCCAHHVRGCETKHTSRVAHGDTTLDRQCPECGCGQSHQGSRDCQNRKCFRTSPRRPLGRPFGPPLLVSAAIMPDAHLTRLATRWQHQSPATGRLLLPVRLYLANQVLLI